MPRKKRGPGEGSIYKRKDGLWAVELFLGFGPDGKKKKVTAYAKTHAEAKQKLLDLLKDRQTGVLVSPPERQTVAEFLRQWLRDVVAGSVRPRTLENYEYVIRHVVDEIGNVPITKLTPQHLQRLYRKKQDQGLTRMVVLIHAVMHKALAQAVKWGIVPRNAADAVERPKVQKREIRPLSKDELVRFLAAAEDDPLYALYVLAATCGLRMGELLGLKWEDVDFANGLLTVRRQLQWIKGEPVFAPPKSAKSRRTIPLTSAALAALRRHKEQQAEQRLRVGEAWKDYGLVFTTGIGTPLSPSNVRNRSFFPLLRKAGLPRIRFHDLRHTTATALLVQGVHPRLVQDLLGHSQISVTLDTYSHVTAAMLRQTADAMDRFLGSGEGAPGPHSRTTGISTGMGSEKGATR